MPMGKHFWNDSIGPFLPHQRDTLERGYDSIIYEVRETMAECQTMLARFEDRIADREKNRLIGLDSDLDPEHQETLDSYYRSEAHKMRWLIRCLKAVIDRAEAPAHDPERQTIKVVSIR